jgi:hypothetical protein
MRIDNRPTRSARGHSGFDFLLGVSRFDERTPPPAFLVDLCKEPEFAGASEQVFEHSRILFEMLARGPRAAIEPLLRFPEFAENCLGYAASGVDGAGSGRNRARAMRRLGDVERGPRDGVEPPSGKSTDALAWYASAVH